MKFGGFLLGLLRLNSFLNGILVGYYIIFGLILHFKICIVVGSCFEWVIGILSTAFWKMDDGKVGMIWYNF